jgi:RNA-directed DNA polymerase
MAGTSNPGTVSTKQQRIAQLAKQAPQMSFTSLAYYIDIDWLEQAYQQVRKDAAPGVDGQTARDYGKNLQANLQALLDRAKSGTYCAPPVRRVYIPKGSGTDLRPLGIPTFEDKVLQRAVVMVLEPLYEQDFRDCSYGYRPGRSAHQALQTLWQQAMKTQGGWILEVDIRQYFDRLDHAHLRAFLQRRVRDGVLLRLIGKWLNAGVLEDGCLTDPQAGTPQGGVISPLLANIYLHYVLDVWFEDEVKPRLRGQAFLVRYADDMVIGFTDASDAQRVQAVLPKRFGKYGLELHPDKTRLVPFQRPMLRGPKRPTPRSEPPGTFEFLGFLHHWGRSWKGFWVLKQRTSSSRFSRTLRRVNAWCRRVRHLPVGEQQRQLNQQLQGHYGYFGITGNYGALQRLWFAVTALWRKWLSRRGSGWLSWERFQLLLAAYPIMLPRVVHSVYRRAAKPC